MLALHDLGVRLGESGHSERWILRHIDLSLATGQSVAVIGRSGSGRSVLLRAIAGLLPASEGRVEMPSDARVAMVFQRNALFDSSSVIDNLLIPLREVMGQRGAPARRSAMHWLERVGLAEAAERFPSEISGGMQKRLGIARALVVRPTHALLDEPTAGLDPITSRAIGGLLAELMREHAMTTIVATSELPRALELGQWLCALAPSDAPSDASASDSRALAAASTLSQPLPRGQIDQSTDPWIRRFVSAARLPEGRAP